MEEEKVTAPAEKTVEAKPKKESNHTALIAIIILILVGAVGFRAFYFYKKMKMSNPINVTTGLIDKLEKSSNQIINESKLFDIEKPTKLTINGTVNEIDFNLESGLDLKNNIINLLTSIKIDKDSVSFDGTITKNNLAFNFNNNPNSYAYADDFGEVFTKVNEYFEKVNNNDTSKYFTYLKESFEENYQKEYFEKSSDDIKLFSEKVSVTKYQTELNDERLSKIANSFIDKLKNDEDFINLALDILKETDPSVTKEDIIEELSDAKDSMKDSLADVKIKYTLYISGSDLVRISFEENTMGSLVIDSYKDNVMVKYNVSEVEAYIKYNVKTTKFSVNYNNEDIMTGTYKEDIKSGLVAYNITFNIPRADLTGKLNFKAEAVNKLEEKNYANALDITKEENAVKLYEEVTSNKLLMQLYQTIDGYFNGTSNWDSVDGLES